MMMIFRLIFTLVFLFKTLASANYVSTALISDLVSDQNLLATTTSAQWDIGEILPIVSQNSKNGVIAYVELQNIKELIPQQKYELKLRLIRQSRKLLIQKGDIVKHFDLSTTHPDYVGTTELLIKSSERNISSKYRPLFYQGLTIGETANTLYKNEYLVTYLGNIYYGALDWLTLNTFITANLVGNPNAAFKAKFYDSDSTTLSVGLSYVRIEKDDQSSVNLNFYWDSTSSDTLISHTFLGLNLVKWEDAKDATAIKALSSSSFQTGYEIINSDWNRVLLGPSYNFQTKALGGYLSYIYIYDRFHAQISVNATDITHFRLDPTDGYYGFLDFYWRF